MDRKWWTLIAVCVATFMLLLDVTIVNVALPKIQSSINASFSDLQWVVDAYALMLAALLLTTGSLADLWGRRLIFVLGLGIFTASSLASGLAQSPLWLNLARGAQGVGGAAMFSTSLALLGSSFRGRERGVAFGVWGAITGLAVAVGPVVGGALTTGLSWRWIFLVNVPIGVVAVLISLRRVEESRMPFARRPDVIGVVTFSGALGALVYALIKGDSKGWGSSVILGCLIGAAVLLVIFVIAELLQPQRAMFDFKLFRKPTFTGGLLTAFALSGGLFALFLYLTLYFQDVLGYSALQTGLRFLVLSGGILLTSTVAGRLTAHVPIRFLICPGLLLVGGGLLLMRGVTATSGWTHLIPGFILAGAGTGLINPPLASTAIGVVRPERAGMASGINSTFRQVGIATGIAGLGSIFTHAVRTKIVELLQGAAGVSAAQAHALANGVASGTGSRAGLQSLAPPARAAAAHALRAGFAHGLNVVFLVGAILSLICGVLALLLIRSKDFEEGHARATGGSQRPPQQPAPEPATRDQAVRPHAPTPDPDPESELDPEFGPGQDADSGPRLEPEFERTSAEPLQPRPLLAFAASRVAQPAAPAPSAPDEFEPDDPPLADPEPVSFEIEPDPIRADPYDFDPSAAPSPPPHSEPAPDAHNGDDPLMTSDIPPSARDVRVVEEAVRGAEEAAIAYAREIGEARRHLTKAIEHFDRAEEARVRLNRHATGFMGSERRPDPGSSPVARPDAFGHDPGPAAGPADDPPMPAPARSAAAIEEDRPVHPPSAGDIATPHPGIAVAGRGATATPPPPPPPGWAGGGSGR